MDEVTDGSYNERAISTRYPNSEGLSFELLAAALSEYRPVSFCPPHAKFAFREMVNGQVRHS